MRSVPHTSLHRRLRAAFTLIELLLVIAIMGVLAAVLIPQFSAGSSGVQVRTAAMAYMQSARYARTMALLYQLETVIACDAGGVLRVEAGAARGEAQGPYVAPPEPTGTAAEGGDTARLFSKAEPPAGAAGTKASSSARLLSLKQPGTSALDQPGAGAEPDTESPATAEELATAGDPAAAIRAEQTFESVHFTFLEFTDERPDDAARDAMVGTESFRISYRSNGTCRPYRVRVADNSGTELFLSVDMLGMTVIEGDERE